MKIYFKQKPMPNKGVSLIMQKCTTLNNRNIARMAVGWSPGRDEAAALRDEFDRLNCRHHFLVAKPARREPMPKACEAILYSISFYAFEGK